MKQLDCQVPVLVAFDERGIRPLAFRYQGRRWPVQRVVRDWRQFALLDEQVHIFLVETDSQLAQLSYHPQRGCWQLDKF